MDFHEDYNTHRKMLAAIAFTIGLLVICTAMMIAATGCNTIAPGQDPVVVRAEQMLQAAPAVYDHALTWAQENKATLSPSALVAVNKVRVAFPGVYKTLDDALQAYKAGKTNDVAGATVALSNLVTELITTIKVAGGPDLGVQK